MEEEEFQVLETSGEENLSYSVWELLSRLEDNGWDIELNNLACNILAPGSHSQV